jgi:glycerol uptake facilitator-like aquaporin
MYNLSIIEFIGTSLVVGAVAFGGPMLVVAALAIALYFEPKGHFNPAITLWSLASGKIGQQKAIATLIAQGCAALFIWLSASVIKV